MNNQLKKDIAEWQLRADKTSIETRAAKAMGEYIILAEEARTLLSRANESL